MSLIEDWRMRLSTNGWHPARVGDRDDIWLEGSRQLDLFWPTERSPFIVRFLFRSRGDLGNVQLFFDPENAYTLHLIVNGGKN